MCSFSKASLLPDVLVNFCHELAGIVGEIEEIGEDKNYFIWTHKKFDIGYSDNQVCVCPYIRMLESGC